MCVVCNPFCGKCRPAIKARALCPECGKSLILKRSECDDAGFGVCPECGSKVMSGFCVGSVFCMRVLKRCGNPCQEAFGKPSDFPSGCDRFVSA